MIFHQFVNFTGNSSLICLNLVQIFGFISLLSDCILRISRFSLFSWFVKLLELNLSQLIQWIKNLVLDF